MTASDEVAPVLRFPAHHRRAGDRARADHDTRDRDRRCARGVRRTADRDRHHARQRRAACRHCARPELGPAGFRRFDYCAGSAPLISFDSASRLGVTLAQQQTPRRAHVHAWRGFIVAITNPKTIAFFTAFLPQFIDPALPVGRQLVAMCAVTVVVAGLLDAAWGVTAGLSRAFLMKPRQNKLLGRLSGTVLIGGGLWLCGAAPAGVRVQFARRWPLTSRTWALPAEVPTQP